MIRIFVEFKFEIYNKNIEDFIATFTCFLNGLQRICANWQRTKYMFYQELKGMYANNNEGTK